MTCRPPRGKGTFIPLLQGQPLQTWRVNLDLCQLHPWHKSALTWEVRSSPGKGSQDWVGAWGQPRDPVRQQEVSACADNYWDVCQSSPAQGQGRVGRIWNREKIAQGMGILG